jgi:hypothetical protein
VAWIRVLTGRTGRPRCGSAVSVTICSPT